MTPQPEWRTLSEINFIIHRRLAEHLNAALAAISLIGADDPPDPAYWRERALNEVLRALEVHEAWASLIRYKKGETFLRQHKRQFRASEMLTWLARELQLAHTAQLQRDVPLVGNRETLQEALLLLYACAYTLGPNVKLAATIERGGMWFRIRFRAVKSVPASFDKLVDGLLKLKNNWRATGTAFELMCARDFLLMNGCTLDYAITDGVCEFSFFMRALTPASAADTQPRKADLKRASSSAPDSSPHDTVRLAALSSARLAEQDDIVMEDDDTLIKAGRTRSTDTPLLPRKR